MLQVGPKTSSEVELMETIGFALWFQQIASPKTSSEVELMETALDPAGERDAPPKTSSEVELMETV
ncbi:hypothetical protein [Halomicronema hongdechloris]